MKTNKWIINFFIVCLYCLHLKAQTTQVLTVDSFITQVKSFHPLVKQADLVTEKADANLLAARGAFDPLFRWNIDNKTLDGQSYFRYSNPELKIPTGIGVTVKGGFERSFGQYINPEKTNGVASYLGLDLPLLNGLITDESRTHLQQAKIYRDLGDEQRAGIINDLLLSAYAAYWDWAGTFQRYRVYAGFLEMAEKRSRLVKISFNNGDRSMADTIEAQGQYEYYRMLKEQALLELMNAEIRLSDFLWTEEEMPVTLQNNLVPDTLFFNQPLPLPGTVNTADLLDHPELNAVRYKGAMLEAERRLKKQNLLPNISLQGNILSKEYFAYKDLSAMYLENNYKIGVKASMPIPFREGRGEYARAKLDIRENELELQRKTRDIQNKVNVYYQEIIQLQQQVNRATDVYKAAQSLLKTENIKFSQGESSLFLVNSRENNLLQIQEKLIELQVKYLKSYAAFLWAQGIIE